MMIKEYPNNQDLAEAVRKYAAENRTCCDNSENHVSSTKNDQFPYGNTIKFTICKECAKIVDVEFVS